jgi:hypothetical protein
MIHAVKRNGALIGWVQRRGTEGPWRALTVSGLLTYHPTRQQAREALLCSS